MGNRGDIKLIDKAAKMLLSPNSNYSLDTMNSVRKMNDVSFEIGELGVKVVDKNTSEVCMPINKQFLVIIASTNIFLKCCHRGYWSDPQVCLELITKSIV